MSNELLYIVLFIIFIALPIFLLIMFPGLRKALGLVLIVVGILLSITGIGAILGIPMLIIGSLLFFIGQKNKVDGYQQKQNQQQIINISGQTQEEKIQVRCPSCKKLNVESASFCQFCGHQLT